MSRYDTRRSTIDPNLAALVYRGGQLSQGQWRCVIRRRALRAARRSRWLWDAVLLVAVLGLVLGALYCLPA